MRIMVDIGHPAHVHLFKNLAFDMTRNGHKFLFTVREGENQELLLKEYGLDYRIIGLKQKGKIKKLLWIIIFSLRIYKESRKFKPDIFLSHGSMYAGYAALLYRKKHIALEDTGNMEQLIFSRPVSDVIISPQALQVDLGKKQIRYNGFHELAYLHPKRFKPDISVLEDLNVKNGEVFVIFRFVSWNATHDIGQSGLSLRQKTSLVKEISEYAKVFISSECTLPPEFEEYTLTIAPHRLHHALFYSAMYIGEGATTASECAMLGTPALFISSISADTLKRQEKYGLVFCFINFEGLIEKAVTLMKTPFMKEEFLKKRNKMLDENIDVTSFLLWFIENFPESKTILDRDKLFQNTFK